MSSAIEQCKQWVDKVVVEHQFCPFAKKEIRNNRVRYSAFEGVDIESLLHLLVKECEQLDDEGIETTLIVIEEMCKSFDEFLDVVALSEQLMQELNYNGVYQLASFHPNYCFNGVAEDDVSNYTNRSPFPILHLLRERSLEEAVKNYTNPEKIPENNIKLAREKGEEYFQAILNSIR